MPVVVLVIACIIGLIYTGGFFSGESFVSAFANCSASMGLVLGSSVALVFAIIFFIARRVLAFQHEEIEVDHTSSAWPASPKGLRPWFPPSSF